MPVSRKIAYGVGGLVDFLFINVLNSLAVPIFVIALKMDPFLLGIAMAIPKIVGAIADPLVGSTSDNLRSHWGRRRPFILTGAIAGALLLPLLWFPPSGSKSLMFGFLVITMSLHAVAYSVFATPYGALGFELTTDYDERTRVLTWRGYISTIGTFAAAWFYWFCLLPVFANEVVGVRWLSLAAALVIIAGTAFTVLACREKTEQQRQPKVPIGKALRLTLGNRPFLLLQAASLVVTLGLGITGTLGSYVHIYYVCMGNKAFSSVITGFGGTLTIITSLLAMPLGLWISSHLGKREAALAGLLITFAGVVILPWSLTPEHPWWCVISWVICALGMPCTSLMFGSMTADICDEDELRTGLRREGSYCAVGSFLGKIMQIVLLVLGGFLPRLTGYSGHDAPPAPDILFRMKTLLITIQWCGILAALLILWFYPITRAWSERTRRELDARKKQ